MLESHSVDICDIHINKSELAQRLKTPVGFEHETVAECEQMLKKICTPKFCVREIEIRAESPNIVYLGIFRVLSKDLFKNLSGCNNAYLMGLTLGYEVDRLILSTGVVSPAKGFILDAVASAYAEALADYVSTFLQKDKKLRARYSPGYGDLSLDIQAAVLNALNADKILGIKLGTNFLMTPRKSVTAIQGVINND